MSKTTQTFFPGTKRQIITTGIHALRAKNDERRIKLQCSLPLTGESLVGMPGWMGDAFDAIAKDDGGVKSMAIDVSYRGMNVNVFATPKSARQLQLANSQLQKFSLVKQGKGDDPEINLVFSAYVPMSAEAWEWAGGMIGNSFYAGFVQTQKEIFGDEDDEDNDTDDTGQMSLEEAARVEAVSPKNDAEWAKAHKPPAKRTKPAASKRVH